MPGLITKGQYPDSFPMLPRMLLRNCDLRGTTCLDLGSMEGLMPVLMCRQGAKAVTGYRRHRSLPGKDGGASLLLQSQL